MRFCTPIRYLLLFVSCFFVLASCQSGHQESVKQQEPYPLLRHDHPLAGKIWDVANESYIEKPELLQKIFDSKYVLLGETHDNMQHHNDHGLIIRQLAQRKPRTGVAFEMVNAEQVKVINNTTINNTDELLDVLEKAKTGWEYHKYYRPVFDSVFNAGLKIYPGDLDRETMMKTVSKGVDNAPPEVQALLEKDLLTETDRKSLKKEIEGTHCGMINDEMTKAMMLGQQVRDANIASNIYKINADGAEAMVLISGSGHVRKDRGAPMYLASLDKDATILSVAWLEVAEEATDPLDYAKPWGQEKLPFDYVVFTPGADRPDPCEEMKKFMHHKKLKEKEQKESD